MGQRNWEDEYERIVEESLANGRIRKLPSRSEKRRHPRFKLARGQQVLVTEPVPHEVVDISMSGLAFHSAREFPVGHLLMVSLRQILAIQAEVRGCEQVGEAGSDTAFRVRCRFTDSDYGLRFLVLAIEMESGGDFAAAGD